MSGKAKPAAYAFHGCDSSLRTSKTKILSVAIMIALLLALILCSCSKTDANIGEARESTAAPRSITDMAGREVTIPAEIKKAYSTGQPGVVMLYTLSPERLLGWCLRVGDEEGAYLDPKYLSLPVLGLMQGSNNTANKEEIIARGPDIILYMTAIADTTARTADDIQENMQIPVVTVDYSLDKLGEAYMFVGSLLGEDERAGKLAEYCDDAVGEAASIASSIPESERVSVYYAQGTNGLQTAPAGSAHSQVIDTAGGNNVVRLDADTDGRLTINMEQLLVYDPDCILLSYSMGHEGTKMFSDDGTFAMIMSDERWANLSAVKNGRVFVTPCYPYNWQDMPPSANRVIGLRWLCALLYPERCGIDIRDAAREFYSLFYRVDLTEDQLDILLKNALP